MNNQQAFTQMVTHLRKQNAQSIFEDTCLYRGPDGLKCAVGALIPDDIYDPEMDVMATPLSSFELLRRFDSVQHHLSGVHPQLLADMQSAHDNFDPCEWEKYFRDVAETYNLELPNAGP